MLLRAGLLAVGLLLTVLATVALAKPAKGHYSATGTSVNFTFSIAKGRCRAAGSNTPGGPAAGAFGHGLCFHTSDSFIPIPKLTCPAGTSVGGQAQLEIGLFDKLRFSAAGSLVEKVFASDGSYSELSLHMTGKTGSGFLEQTEAVGSAGFCDSGQLDFTVTHA